MSDYETVSSDEEETKQEEPSTIDHDIVVTKYKMAAEITNRKFK